VNRCLPLADHIARRYRGRGEPFDDLVQAARLGLVNALNRFDVDNGADFVSFAVPTMMGEVRRHFRDHGWAVKVPRRVKELQPQLIRARAELSQRLGRAPTASEVADHLGVARDLVIEATIGGGNYSTVSTDRPVGPGDHYRPFGDTLGDVDINLDKVLDVETVRPLIAALPERQRTVLTLRFFENLTQTQIAERIGCSQMHISRLLAKALDTLRHHVRQPELAAPGQRQVFES
jgi:RNA polymerase sigma-B factor